MNVVEHEQWRLRQVDVPTKPQRKAHLVFFLIFVGIVAIASAIAVYADVATDGYRYHAAQKALRFS